MITFEKIRWKNLLSTGNIFTEIKLNETSNSLVIGENGAGKSTILDAICFALFGKAFRKINKPSLVNSVNTKECVVEIEFRTNGKAYKIVRGIKPNVFEIYCEGVLLNQDSASKDYQEHLEKFVLKMNYKSFTQIVILGSASFTPFMQLSSNDRRTVIEDLLDIQIFSVMNTIAKQKMQENKDTLERNRLTLSSKEDLKVFIEKNINSLRQNNEEIKNDLLSQKEDHEQSIITHKEEVRALNERLGTLIDEASEKAKSKEKHKKLIALQSKIESNSNRMESEISFYCDNDTCPTCRQSIDSGFKAEAVDTNTKKLEELTQGLRDIGDQISLCVAAINESDKLIGEANTVKNRITSINANISNLVSHINDIEDQIEKMETSDSVLIENETSLKIVLEELLILNKEKSDLLSDRKYIETAISLLKDGGIKTKIIKQYLPVINKLINKYLAQMGFFVNFNINEQFEETIKSRYRDEFSYHNFSEGEKMRIDLALLFTWRTIAKMRNSVSTNLLILDEVLDSSLDNNGTDEFLKIMWDMLGDTNTFVISHKTDTLLDKFQKVYRFEKHKNFSRLAV
jgi:DNA repair exonuclease SbcCD ATPase subunit